MATFSVTEKKPTKVEAVVALELSSDEAQFLAVAAKYYSTTTKFSPLVHQLGNAARQAKEIENG